MRNQLLQLKESFWHIVLVFFTSILATLLFWGVLPTQFRINDNSDYISFYKPVAHNILAGHGLVIPDEGPALRYPPGYPLLLAGIFGLSHLLEIPEEAGLSAFVLLCMALTSVFVYLLAQSVWGPLPALISALIWMTYPFALWLTKQQGSEMPFLVVFYGGVYLFWRALLGKTRSWPVYFLSGLLVGFSMLIRPIAIGVVIVMSVILWVVGREIAARLRLFLVMMLLLGSLVTVLPWEVWVYSMTNRVVMLSTGGAPSIHDGLTFAVASKGYRQEIKVPEDVAALMQDMLVHADKMRSLGEIVSVLTEKLWAQPLTVVKLFTLKAARSWYGIDSGRFEIPIMLIQTAYFVLILWGSGAAWRRGSIPKQLAISIWFLVLYFWATTILALSILRYMVPAIGLLFVLIPGSFSNRVSSLSRAR